jgi:catechol 2,3-dioxygenase-like lactoylglutathione lyase family enzyme
MATSPGLHHVTAIAGDAQQNVDFCAGVLGLRLVKKTVNFPWQRAQVLPPLYAPPAIVVPDSEVAS